MQTETAKQTEAVSENPTSSVPGLTLEKTIADRFGCLPNFFRLASSDPQIAVNLWGFAQFAYLDNPLPSLFKERLFVYLSRFCEIRYCIARHLGYTVISDNHIGDWGTQFGMILHGWKTLLDHAALEVDPIPELVRVYRDVNAAAKADPTVLDLCKSELVRLQAGDAENLLIWRQCIEVSKNGLQKIYDRLDVSFDYWLGESFYNDQLAGIVDDFLTKGIARVSDGAVCIFASGEFSNEQDPFRVNKENGWTDNPAIIWNNSPHIAPVEPLPPEPMLMLFGLALA